MSEFLKLCNSMPWTARFGSIMIVFYVAVAVFAPAIAPFGETEIVGAKYEPWSVKHSIGTDKLGRDMLTRVIYGARNTITIAILTTAVTFFIGVLGGLLAATLGGWVDQVLSRTVDLLMAIPMMIGALLLLTIFGTSVPVMIWVIALVMSTRVYRLARAVSMDIVAQEFVEVARLRGERLWFIIWREILPNILAPLAAEFGIRFCYVFLFISSLSFLGLGIQPPTADWGSMVRENSTLITFGDLTPLIPAGAIALLSVSVNFVVDWFLHKMSGLKE